jgi:rhodanese-related sulfurtransferase
MRWDLGLNLAIACCSCLLMCTQSVAAAQDPIDAALREARPKGSACVKADDAPAEPTMPAARELAAPDLACTITVPALAQLRGDPNALIVDTRSASEYGAYHIDSAVNISWGELRARKYLHTRPITLVGSGKGASTLYTACAELKAAGVTRVHVLRGGMLGWANANQPVVGRAPDLLESATLTEEELLDEMAFSANIVLASPAAKALQKQIPRAIPMNGTDGKALERILAQRQREVGPSPFSSIVILSGVDTRAADLTSMFQAAGAEPLLIYKGTEQKYVTFMKSKRAVWLASARGPTQPRCPAL